MYNFGTQILKEKNAKLSIKYVHVYTCNYSI